VVALHLVYPSSGRKPACIHPWLLTVSSDQPARQSDWARGEKGWSRGTGERDQNRNPIQGLISAYLVFDTVLFRLGTGNMYLFKMAKPSIPEKPKHLDLIRRKVWIRKENIQTIQQGPSKQISNVRKRFSTRSTSSKFLMSYLFQDKEFSHKENISDIVLDIQSEILKLISEKDDLIKENEVLKHYRLSCMKLQEENFKLSERLELLQASSCCVDYPGLSRTSPDGQAGAQQNEENSTLPNCDQGVDVKSIE
jgi:hypothetical protein